MHHVIARHEAISIPVHRFRTTSCLAVTVYVKNVKPPNAPRLCEARSNLLFLSTALGSFVPRSDAVRVKNFLTRKCITSLRGTKQSPFLSNALRSLLLRSDGICKNFLTRQMRLVFARKEVISLPTNKLRL